MSFVLNVTNAECHYAESHCAECHYAECHYAECYYDECHYDECHYDCHYAECRGAILSYCKITKMFFYNVKIKMYNAAVKYAEIVSLRCCKNAKN